MASKKGFKPPVKKQVSSTKAAHVKKDGAKPLSDSQYEKIFDAVLDFQGNRSPVQAESTKMCATEPGECASTGNSQSSQANRDNCDKVDSETQVSASTQSVATQVSVLTESVVIKTRVQQATDSNCSSLCAGGVKPKFKRPNTLREALKVQESSSQFSSSLSQVGTGSLVLASDAVLSQAPKHFRHRQRLQWLQDRRGGGMYIQCDNCKKWRWSDIDDPVDVPKKWTCRQNEDTNYNACHIPEQPISVYIEEDLIHNEYTAGSIVWAKLDGYPWWPAMVDDCPDTEQYYWLDGYSDIPTHYHVVFFDYESNEIGRSWLAVRELISFKHQPALDTKFSLKPGHKSRISCAKVQAQDALKFRVKERLRRWSFLARWTGEIVTPPASDSELQETASAKGKGGVKKRKRRSQKEQSREKMGDSSDDEWRQPEGKNKGKKSTRAKKNREDNCKRRNKEEADGAGVEKKLRVELEDGTGSQNSVSDQSFEEITLKVAEIVGEPVCINTEEQSEDYTSAEAAEEVTAELRQAEAAEDVQSELLSAKAAEESEDEDTQVPQPPADEDDSSMMDPVHTYSQDSSMEAFPLEESDAEEDEPKLQQYMTQTLGQQVSIFETSAQSVSEEEDEQLKRLQEHISRSQNVEATTPAKLTAKDVNVTASPTRVMRVEDSPGSRGTKRQTGTDKDAVGMKKRARQMGAKDGQDADDDDEESRETGEEREARKGKASGKENHEKWEKRKIGKKLNVADFALKRRRSKDSEGKRGKMARSDGKTGTAGDKDGTSVKSGSKPARSDNKPAKDARSDSKLGKNDTKDAKGDSKPAKDTKDAKGDSKDAKSDSKLAKSDTKDAKSDSKPTKDARSDSKLGKSDTKGDKGDSKPAKEAKSDSKLGKSDTKDAKSDNKLAKDTKDAKGVSKDAKSDSKLAKSDNNPVKDAKSDSKPAKSDTKDVKGDNKPTKDTKDAKGDSKDAKSDSKLAKSDIKDAKSDSKPAKGTKTAESDRKPARSDSKLAKDAPSDSKLAKDAKSDSKLAKETKPTKSDIKITKSDNKPARSDSRLAKNDTKVATDDATATSDSKIAKNVTKVAKGDTKLARDAKPTKTDTKPAKSDPKPSSIDTTKPSTSGLNNPTQKRSKKTRLFQPPVRKSSTSESARSEEHSEPQSHPPGSEQLLDITSSQSLSSSVAVVPNSEDRLLDILNRLSQESLPFDP